MFHVHYSCKTTWTIKILGTDMVSVMRSTETKSTLKHKIHVYSMYFLYVFMQLAYAVCISIS